MYKFYRKSEKTEENEHGLEIVEGGNPFERPTFLSLLALNMRLRDTNGSISRILELSGVRTPNGEENIPLDQVPVNFLGLSYSEVSPEGRFRKIASGDNFQKISEETISFVHTYILPLISVNGQKRDITECCRNMRNINIMCFCDAIFMVGAMNRILIEEMQKIGFTEEEIDTILSQVCIIPVGTEYSAIEGFIKNIKFTTVFLLDIIDTFGITDSQTISEILGGSKEAFFRSSYAMDMEDDEVSKNSRMLIVDGGGDHDLKSFIHKGVTYPAIIVRLVNAILNNSVRNSKNPDEFIPLDVVIEEQLEKIVEYYTSQEGLSQEEIIASVLQSISYPTSGEIDLDSLDQGFKK